MLELIVAMGMVVILAMSLYASLRIAFRSRDGAVASVEPARTAQLVLDLLQQDFQNAMNDDTNPTTGNNVGLTGNFEGTTGTDNRGREDDDVNFYTTADSPQHVDANGEIKNVELTVIQPKDNENDHVLIRRVNRNLFVSTAAQPDVEVLCRNVGAFTLQYWNGTAWVPSWDDTQLDYQLPTAIMITLQLDRPIDGNAANTSPANIRSYTFTRVVPLSCSNAEFDPQVNTSYTGSSSS